MQSLVFGLQADLTRQLRQQLYPSASMPRAVIVSTLLALLSLGPRNAETQGNWSDNGIKIYKFWRIIINNIYIVSRRINVNILLTSYRKFREIVAIWFKKIRSNYKSYLNISSNQCMIWKIRVGPMLVYGWYIPIRNRRKSRQVTEVYDYQFRISLQFLNLRGTKNT